MAKITERLKHLVTQCTSEAKKFKELEEATGITSGTWRSWWNRNGTPSGEMIEAVSQAWPQYAFWLATGIDDPKYGHHAPGLNQHVRIRTAARDLFLAELELKRWIEVEDFDYDDLAHYAEPENQPYDDTIAKKIAGLLKIDGRITQLTVIRTEQQTSLSKHEDEQALKEFLG